MTDLPEAFLPRRSPTPDSPDEGYNACLEATRAADLWRMNQLHTQYMAESKQFHREIVETDKKTSRLFKEALDLIDMLNDQRKELLNALAALKEADANGT